MIKLYVESYADCDDECCCGGLWLELYKDDKIIWASNFYTSNDPNKTQLLREELEIEFENLGLNTADIIDFDIDCIFDWEYEK